MKDALYYLTLCSINCSHYTTISASTGSKHGKCLRCRYIGSFVTQKSMSCTAQAFCAHVPPSQHCLHLAQAIIITGQEAPSWYTASFRFRQIPFSELKLRQPNCSNFPLFFPTFLISFLNDSTLLNNWQICTNRAPGMDPFMCSTHTQDLRPKSLSISIYILYIYKTNFWTDIGQIVCNKMTKHL